MGEVVGGSLTGFSYVYTRTYWQRSATITEKYNGYSAKIYYRKMINGNNGESTWINYTNNGRTYQAYGSKASSLISKYQTQIKRGY